MMVDDRSHRIALGRIQLRALAVLALFAGIVTAKVWLVEWSVLGGTSPVGLAMDALAVLALFAAVDLFFADMRFRAMLVLDVVVTLLLLGVSVYSAYYQVLPTKGALAALGQATQVSTSIATLVDPVYLLFLADIPLLAWWAARCVRRGIDPVTGSRSGSVPVPGLRTPYVYQRKSVYVAGVVAAAVFVAFVNQARLDDLASAKVVARERGMLTYIAADVVGEKQSTASAMAQEVSSVPQLQARIDELAQRTSGAPLAGFTPGQAKGSNVIVIQVEALQSIAVGHAIGGASVTPNLDSLMEESFYFPNCVSGAGVGTTADVEFVTNTSLYPPTDVGASLGWSDRQLTSLPRMLGAQGYESYTFHTNTAQFWNRTQFYPALGFTRYYDRTYFGTADKMAFESAGDEVLFDKTLPQLTMAAQKGTPFYAQVITMSSHYPFRNVPSGRRKLRLEPPYSGTITGDYLTELNYADEQVGRFVAQLKETGLWEDSVVIVYGDHFGLPEPRSDKEADALRALAGHDYNQADRLLVPLFVHLPGQARGSRVDVPVGQVDLVPTIADALGANVDDVAQFGRSVLREGSAVISAGGLVGQGGYVDGSVFCVPGAKPGHHEVFDVRTREKVSPSLGSADKLEDVSELLRLSREYVASLPLREDFDPDAEISFPRRR